jgi:hypothetical protein
MNTQIIQVNTEEVVVNFNHPNQVIEQWENISKSSFINFPEERQAYVLQAINGHNKKKWCLHRIVELGADRPLPPISKKLMKIVVLIIGSATFSAAAGQIARVTLGGAFVVPFSILGGITGAFAAEQSIKYVILAIMLKVSTHLARRSLQKCQPTKETLKFEAHQAQVDIFEAVESMHDHLPKLPISIFVFLCAIEASAVFSSSLRFGLLTATVSALLPLALLLAIAYFYVRTFELPYKNQEIIQRYLARISSGESRKNQPFMLIPNNHEYDALHFNGHLVWINTHAPNSPIQTDFMVKCKVDEDYFTTRLSNMDNEYCIAVEEIHKVFRQQVALLDKAPCPESIASLPLPPHQIQAKYSEWYQGKFNQLKDDLEFDLQFIKERLRIAKEQCQSHIEKARSEFYAAQRDLANGNGYIAG